MTFGAEAQTPATDELRSAYRTLNEPTRLLGMPITAWVAVVLVGAAAYGWLSISPLPWRVNFSLVAVGLGAPAGLLVLREAGTVGPARLLVAICAWRARPATAVAVTNARPVRRGGVRLDRPAATVAADEDAANAELPWTSLVSEDDR